MPVRRILQLVLLGQALLLAGLGWLFWRNWALAPWGALALAAAAIVLLRLLVNLNNFVLSLCYASPTPAPLRLRPAGSVRLLAAEFIASMRVTCWAMLRARARLVVPPDAQPLPVLLVHGYACNSGYWDGLRPRLEAARISHATLDLEPLGASIDDYAAPLQDAIARLCDASGAQQVILIGHSMGGLALRAWMRRYGSNQVARLITLGTPHHGTRLASFGLGINCAQMRHDSAWLGALAASEDAGKRALITSLYSHHDNIVAPQTSSQLAGAGQLAFAGVGHVELGYNDAVLDALMAQIAQLEQQAQQAMLAVRR